MSSDHPAPSPEHLSSAGGQALPAAPRRRRRRAWLVALPIVGLVLAGGGVWAWLEYFHQGPQPAEALPDSTIAYVAVDLDPTGQQKVAAIEALEKFPAFDEGVDLDTDDDLRQKLFEELQGEGACPDLDYGDDVEPWLGQRLAVAAVDLGRDQPVPVAVVQVTDEDEAATGLDKVLACGGGGGGHAIDGDWAVIAETDEIAEDVVAASGDGALGDDEDYRSWTEAAGDPGVLHLYLAPEAGRLAVDWLGVMSAGSEPLPADAREALESFPGLAGTLRFSDGDVELEVVTGPLSGVYGDLVRPDAGDDLVAGLPASTALAFGAGFADGWLTSLLEELRPLIESESGLSLEDALAELEAESGLALPEDVETLVGDAFAVALDGSLDADRLRLEGPQALPVAVRIQGEPAEIEAVLDKVRAELGPADAELLVSREVDGGVLVGLDAAHLERVAAGGDLGEQPRFRDVIPDAGDAAAVLYVDFDAGDWLAELARAEGDEEAARNVEPLEALGLSSWEDDGVQHGLLRLTLE